MSRASRADSTSSQRTLINPSSRPERTSSKSGGNPAVESAVTRLLVSIKQLLESLTQWSNQQVSEVHVSDVYVRLGNDFNAAVSAFTAFNIDMSELLSVPDDLRNILETCLAEDATPENLEIFLPNVRKIITNLLQGLRTKQHVYRRIASESKHQSTTSERPESRTSSRHESTSSSGRRRIESSDSLSRRSATSTKSKKDSISSQPSARSSSRPGDAFIGGFALPTPHESGGADPVLPRSSTPSRSSRQHGSDSNGRPPSRSSSATAASPAEPPPPLPSSPSLPDVRPPSVMAPVPSHVQRFSLSDKPVIPSPPPPPTVVVDEASIAADEESVKTDSAQGTPPLTSPLENQPIDSQAPAVQSSLAALKKSDALERRASKRFSTYNISKMTGGSIRERHMPGTPRQHMVASNAALTAGDLAVLTEADEDAEGPAVPAKRGGDRAKSQRPRAPSVIAEADEEDGPPPVPNLPSRDPSPQKPPKDAPRPPQPNGQLSTLPSAPSMDLPTTIQVFLQVGREVKKATIDPGVSLSGLRMIFVDKFSYSPGKENFPAIYIRDPASHVLYELEDTSEVKTGCLLSLNLEPLDQIKQHIDTQISSLSQDIKDLRSLVSSNSRNSMMIPPPIIGQPLSESAAATPRPSERTFRSVARTISRLIPPEQIQHLKDQQAKEKEKEKEPESTVPASPSKTEQPPLAPQITGSTSLQPQMTGASFMSDYGLRVVGDLKTQFDEVQNLRRDLGVMRQLYTDFTKKTKDSLGVLRAQTQNVRQLATTKVGGARAYINEGKTKLDSRSQTALTKMEELQDTLEGIKDDVLKRNVSPRPLVLKNVKGDIDKLTKELEELRDHIQTVKPMWKKTWEAELQNIVEEQQLLTHQEDLLADLLEDLTAVKEVHGHIEKVISLRGSTSQKNLRTGRGYRPPPPEEGHTGLSTVMLEIRGAAVDPERRMKAILANEKSREKEMQSRSDEFQEELAGFVEGKKLKMTGGADEVERIRQKKSEATLKAMFTGSTAPSPSMSAGTLSPSPSNQSLDQPPL